MATSNTLPEGTDSIIAGAGVLGEEEGRDTGRSTIDDGMVGSAGEGAGGGFESSRGDYGSEGRQPRDTSFGDAADPGMSGNSGGSLRQQANDKVLELRGQATDRARDWADQGKTRATDALDNVARMISDTAAQVDDKVGAAYGDYARRAADLVGSFATTLRDKDVDALFADARELVRKSPAMAATAAAVIGFGLVRVVKAGMEPLGGVDAAATKKG